MRKSTESFGEPRLALDFFAGSGLVRLGLAPMFKTVWANDYCPKKAAVYNANFPSEILDGREIESVTGHDLPNADLAWASFPCQDLSLAGNRLGMETGTRSGLFWHWIRVLDEMARRNKRPPVLCAENVVGFLSAHRGRHFKAAYEALRQRGYLVGVVVIDARMFVPQSRPRTFVVAASSDISLRGLTQNVPKLPFHTTPVVKAADVVGDSDWVWWSLPVPAGRVSRFADLCDLNAPCDTEEKTQELLNMLSGANRIKLKAALATRSTWIGTGYRRTRNPNGLGKTQSLELRFDGLAGCLRTPDGGSSRQIVLIVEKGRVRSRLLTVRECARLMGAHDDFQLPGTYNDGYRAMGDAVAVPVTQFLAKQLLAPLVNRFRNMRAA
jgi:DNA (cytosine-5)-methyltransferase 1